MDWFGKQLADSRDASNLRGKDPMSFTKTLFISAALCALTTAPSFAAPDIHLVGTDMARGLRLKADGIGHFKTNIHDVKGSKQTSTVTISGTLSESSAYHNPISLFGYVWRQGCTPITPEKQKYTKSKVAKIAKGTTTGVISGCTAVTTFYGPVYTLRSKKAKSDSFVGHLTAKISGIKLNLVENVNLTISH
jgi:hypothetical protein